LSGPDVISMNPPKVVAYGHECCGPRRCPSILHSRSKGKMHNGDNSDTMGKMSVLDCDLIRFGADVLPAKDTKIVKAKLKFFNDELMDGCTY
jgi:hypothetical protein